MDKELNADSIQMLNSVVVVVGSGCGNGGTKRTHDSGSSQYEMCSSNETINGH